MINIETKNKLEQLEKKVEEMERQLKQKTTLENTVKEMEKRLMIYEDKIRSDKGEVTLKKNFVIKNRKGKVPGRDDDNVDNTVIMYFNGRRTGDLNSIILGSASAGGFHNNSLVSLEVAQKNDVEPSANNGKIQMFLVREDQDRDTTLSNLVIGDLRGQNTTDDPNSIPDEDGVFAYLTGTDDGTAAIANYNYSTGDFNYVEVTKDNILIQGIPESDPEVDGAIYNDNGTLKISSVEES